MNVKEVLLCYEIRELIADLQKNPSKQTLQQIDNAVSMLLHIAHKQNNEKSHHIDSFYHDSSTSIETGQ